METSETSRRAQVPGMTIVRSSRIADRTVDDRERGQGLDKYPARRMSSDQLLLAVLSQGTCASKTSRVYPTRYVGAILSSRVRPLKIAQNLLRYQQL